MIKIIGRVLHSFRSNVRKPWREGPGACQMCWSALMSSSGRVEKRSASDFSMM